MIGNLPFEENIKPMRAILMMPKPYKNHIPKKKIELKFEMR